MLTDPKEMRTPDLVREYTARKTADARGERANARQHARHCLIVDELRERHILD